MNKVDIRAYTWLKPNLSWAFVIYDLINAFDRLGHNTYALSTNGMDESFFDEPNKRLKSIVGLEPFNRGEKQIYLDFAYTVPTNYSKRFLPHSKHKAIIYNYETTIMPEEWKPQYDYVDFHFPSSNFCAEVFYRNGVPLEKIFVVPHGVDTRRYNPQVPPIKLKTKKKHKFLSITAPHFRKNIDLLLNAYCQSFTNKDDVCLILKSKIYKHSDGIYSEANPKGRKGYEVVLGQFMKPLIKKYGKKIPEIEILTGHVPNPASIYNACDVHVSATGAEGWGMPFLEQFASAESYNIVSGYSGQRDFINDKNSLIIDTKLRRARNVEQYWHTKPHNKKALIGQPNQKHLSELMIKSYREHNQLLQKFKPEIKRTVEKYSWENAAQTILNVCEGKINHYTPGTYNWWPK